jgi:Glycosyltransferase 61
MAGRAAVWMKELESSHASDPDFIEYFYDSETLQCKAPGGVAEDLSFFPSLRTVRTAKPYVARLKNAEVWADETNGAIVVGGNHVVHDLSPCGDANPTKHWFFTVDLPATEHLDGIAAPIVLRPWWVNAYYHWMFEVLPRLHLLLESRWQSDMYVMHGVRAPFQYETLEAVGITDSALVKIDRPRRLTADAILVTPVLESLVPLWACRFLRKMFLEPPEFHGTSRIYVSREAALRGRRVENEEEVLAALRPYGFAKVVLERLSVQEQARVFAEAGCVVAPHGGGLTNLVFCCPGTNVIELFSPGYVHPLYWMLSNRQGLKYFYVIGRGERPKQVATWPTGDGLDSFTVDVPKLLDLVEQATCT